MIYPTKKAVSFNGQSILLTSQEIDITNRTITIKDEIDKDLAADVCGLLRSLYRDSPEEPITIYLNCDGGSITAGFSIYDTIKALNCPIICCASGMCASMAAFLLAAAGSKGLRYSQPNAQILLHQPLGGTSGQAIDIKYYADHIMASRARLNKLLSDCTGQPVEKIERDTERDKILNAEEALEYGLIDKIGDPISEH